MEGRLEKRKEPKNNQTEIQPRLYKSNILRNVDDFVTRAGSVNEYRQRCDFHIQCFRVVKLYCLGCILSFFFK